MDLLTPGYIAESYFMATPSGGPAVLRSIQRRRQEFPAADSAYYSALTPLAAGTYVFDQLTTQMRLDGLGLLNEAGTAAKFARGYLLHLAVSAYRPELPAAGAVTATFAGLFTTGTHYLDAGDSCLFSCSGATGSPFSGSSSLSLAVASPANLLLELLIIGKEA